MSQSDIYSLLKERILSGDYSYYSAIQIRKMLKDKNININQTSLNNNLLKLRVYGFLDIKIEAKKRKHTKRLYTVYRLNKNTIST